ncbi:MAG TPA: ABC transporter permease, partial [Thermoanaerobacterales bacterium]|nr:ABC transporter permease [Thermoanaerobacterales bacterium]
MAGFGVIANPLRSVLTILGVAIGVASVISLMGIGEGARLAVIEQFESLGSNVIVVEAHHETVEFKPEEADELLDRVEGVEMATPVVHAKTSMRWRRTRGNAKIVGVNNEYPEIKDHPLLSGRFFTSIHTKQRSPVAVLGYNVGVGLMGGRNPVGQTITLDGRSFRVIGVLSLKGEGKADDIDDAVLVPYTTALRFAEKKTVEQIWFKATSPKQADLAVVQMGRIFKRKLGIDQNAPTPSTEGEDSSMGGGAMFMNDMAIHVPGSQGGKPSLPESGEDLITITSLNQLIDEADKANRVMTLLLGGIAAVSLLVGGLGIMNIMLVAVTLYLFPLF